MSPEEQRTQAAEMRRLADQAKDPEVRKQYLLMAADWDRLAADADEQQRRPTAADPKPKSKR